MSYIGPVERWEMYWADLDPGVGSEQKGNPRPIIVVSNDGFNAAFRIVTVLPLTKLEGKQRRVYPFEVLLPQGTVTPDWTSIVMPQQIRTISKLRLIERIGRLDDEPLRETLENRILEHLGIAFEAEMGDGDVP